MFMDERQRKQIISEYEAGTDKPELEEIHGLKRYRLNLILKQADREEHRRNSPGLLDRLEDQPQW